MAIPIDKSLTYATPSSPSQRIGICNKKDPLSGDYNECLYNTHPCKNINNTITDAINKVAPSQDILL